MSIPFALINGGVPPVTIDEVKENAAPVRHDVAESVSEVPDENVVEIDPHVGSGLSAAQAAQPVIASERSRPGARYSWPDAVQKLDDSRSRVGNAARREDAGDWGEGSLEMYFGSRPIFRPDLFGPVYFDAGMDEAQIVVPQAIEGVGFQDEDDVIAAAVAMDRSREATWQAPYGKFEV